MQVIQVVIYRNKNRKIQQAYKTQWIYDYYY